MKPRRKLPIGILASGTGSNFDVIARAASVGTLDAEIRVLVCNRPDAPVVGKAVTCRIDAVVVPHTTHADRAGFDAAVAQILLDRSVELVVMAGFDRRVTSALLSRFPNRVINIHPSLLPAFKGMNAQRQAFEFGARITGATVHLVDEDIDHGPILVQVAVPVLPGDDAETLRRRILVQEHRIYPYAIQLFAEERVRIDGRTVHISGATEEPSTRVPLISPVVGSGPREVEPGK
jgi:phosphoribosylglycinamide formyltransferase-1